MTTSNDNKSQLIINAINSRTELLRMLIDPRRDFNKECGYPDSIDITNYNEMFERDGVSQRLVGLWPEECWQQDPDVYEEEDAEVETDFEARFNEIGRQLDSEGESWSDSDEESNPIWTYLWLADFLCGVGHYGAILLGLDDGAELHTPVGALDRYGLLKRSQKERNLLYLRVFPEPLVRIASFETNQASPRYGLPTAYTVMMMDVNAREVPNGTGVDNKSHTVHWTRMIHVADNTLTSRVIGTPRMKKNFNRLCDIRKIVASSGEMFYKGGFPGFSFEMVPDISDFDIDVKAVREEFDKYSNSLQRYLAIPGLTAKTLSPQVSSPKDHIEQQLKLIAMSEGVPWRVFLGSEEAKLASVEDKKAWNSRVQRRQKKQLSPFVNRFINRLILLGVLPAPAESFYVNWPDMNSVTDLEKAELALKRTQAFQAYLLGQVNTLIPPEPYMTIVHGMPTNEVSTILQAAVEGIGDVENDPIQAQQEMDAEAAAADAEDSHAKQLELQDAKKQPPQGE